MFTTSLNPKSKLSPSILNRARKLRKSATTAEEIFWQLVRNRKLEGLKFRRQHPLHRGFILDFYCDELKLGIELDGGIHDTALQKEYDRLRTEEIDFQQIKIIRFKNDEIFNNIEYVLEYILSFK